MKKKSTENISYEYYGNIGDKFIVNNIKLERIINGESDFGYYNILIMTDNNNHVFVWNTNPNTVYKYLGDNASNRVEEIFSTLSGTIKGHKEYNGRKQTVVTRCKIMK
jgi:hypothetical protein